MESTTAKLIASVISRDSSYGMQLKVVKLMD